MDLQTIQEIITYYMPSIIAIITSILAPLASIFVIIRNAKVMIEHCDDKASKNEVSDLKKAVQELKDYCIASSRANSALREDLRKLNSTISKIEEGCHNGKEN